MAEAPHVEIEDQPINKSNIDDLMSQVKTLENENKLLLNNILKFGTQKQQQSLEYYIRLRNDLSEENAKLTQHLQLLQDSETPIQQQFNTDTENYKSQISLLTSENKTLKTEIEEAQKILDTKKEDLSKRIVELKDEFSDERVEELEQEVNKLTTELNQKECIVDEQKENIDSLQNQIETENEKFMEEINDYEFQYNNLLSVTKQNEENFNKIYEDKTTNMKNDIISTKYQLEKKLVKSKDLLNFLENENVLLTNTNKEFLNYKENELTELKNINNILNDNYKESTKLINDHMQKLKSNISQMKEMYLNRETQTVNFTNIYVDAMNNYSSTISDSEKYKNVVQQDFNNNEQQIKLLTEKNNELENEVKELENSEKQNEYEGASVEEITNKVNDSQQILNNLTEKQNDFYTKIKKVNEFSNELGKKKNLIESLSQENKNLTTKNQELDEKIKKLNLPAENELENLKQKYEQLTKEDLQKNESIQKYEKMFEDVSENMNNNDEVRTDVLKKFGSQISNLKSQIDKLLLSKDNMQNFYTKQVDNLKEKISFFEKENESLKKDSENVKIAAEKQKKNTELWVQEYKKFKDIFYTMSDIDKNSNEFGNECEKLKNNRDFLCEDELTKLKCDLKNLNKEIQTLINKTSKEDTLNPEEIIQNIKLKLNIYKMLIDKKEKEVTGLEQHKKLINDYNNFLTKNGENEELLCEEQKIMIDELINDFEGQNFLTEQMDEEINHLEKKVNEDIYSRNLNMLNESVNSRLKLIKDRENYIVKQSEQITGGLKNVAEQKKNALDTLRTENQQLKNRNYIMNKKL